MSTESDEIKKCIKQLAGTFGLDVVDLIVATVTDNSIAETEWTVTCKPINDSATTEIKSVKLNAEKNDGFLIVPAIDSTVLVISSGINDYYILMYSDVEKIVCVIDNNNSYTFSSSGFVWNDGLNGGLIKIDNLKTQYDTNLAAIKSSVNAALTLIDTQLSALGQPGGSNTAFNAAAAAILNLNKTTLENTKILH